MAESVTKQKIMNCLVNIVPMLTLPFKWSGIEGVKQYSGIAYISRNKAIALLGLVIIFGAILLRINKKYQLGLNMLGYILFWTPLFFKALTTTNSMGNLTVMFYVSLFLVIMSLILQLLISKSKGREFKII